MCVEVVAQPNELLFHNSHFKDIMICFYPLLTSLLELLGGQAARLQLVFCTKITSWQIMKEEQLLMQEEHGKCAV